MSSDVKQHLRNFFDEVWNQGRLEAAAAYFAQDYADHNPVSPGQAPGLAGAQQVFAAFRGAFPNLHMRVEDIIVEGDKAVVRWSSAGDHQGPLMGIPPTGKSVHVTGIEVYRLADGKIVERWGAFDQLGMLQQIGAMSSGGQS